MRKTVGAVVFAATLGLAAAASAQPAIFIVRHAERADAGTPAAKVSGADPDLSEAGRARAASLAAVLKDAKITAIYVTEYKRTAQTAAPLAQALGIQPIAITSKDVPGLAEKVRAAAGNVLVVGHSNSVPTLIKALGGADPPTIAEEEFDNLFVVSRGSPPSVLRLHYR